MIKKIHICPTLTSMAKSEPIIGIIDLGTNTFNLTIVKVKKGKPEFLEKMRISVKLGQGGINKKIITQDAQERAIIAVKEFKKQLDFYNAFHVHATATSAFRNATNADELKSKIKSETGIEVHVISGLEEADYIYKGVKNGFDIGLLPSLIMDVGGGSVEFILCNREEIFYKTSLDIGVQRLYERFHKHEPISEIDLKKLQDYLDEKLVELREEALKYRPVQLIGSSGAFDTFCEIYFEKYNRPNTLEDLHTFSLKSIYFNEVYNTIIDKTKEERLEIPGMVDYRADMIVMAVVLVGAVLDATVTHNIRVSTYALREGVMFDQISLLQTTV